MSQDNASFIWINDHGQGRNVYALFRCSLDLAAAPKSGTLQLFADTRYRLLVNGQVVGHGPGRFFLEAPEYDTIDLTPYLEPGANVIAVMVNSYGCLAYHAEKSIGGLIAWGHVEDANRSAHEIQTDTGWKAMACPGHIPDTSYLSFALHPGELLDARALPTDWAQAGFDDSTWPAAVRLKPQDHWGRLQPRSIALLDEREDLPRKRLGTWVAEPVEDEDVYSVLAVGPARDRSRSGCLVAAMTYLFSPRAQDLTLGAWWGDYWLNGAPLTPMARNDMALRQDFAVSLKEGWNTLVVTAEARPDAWEFYLGVPRGKGVEVSAEKKKGSAHTFLIAGPWSGKEAETAKAFAWPVAAPQDLPDTLGSWREWPRDKRAHSAHGDAAWKQTRKLNGNTDLTVNGKALVDAVGSGTLVLLYDFGNEMLGRPCLTFSAAAGTEVDFFYAERLKDDGSVDQHYRYFVALAERCISREGTQTWQTFHPRGFRYLQVMVTGDIASFEVHKVAATRARYPADPRGAFQCSDPVLTDVWALGVPTLQACREDVYLDCPGRERGLYSGDFLAEFASDMAVHGDACFMRHCVDLYFQAQGENGLIPPGAHGLIPGTHPDYSTILVQALWSYYAYTGDKALVEQLEPRLVRLMEGLNKLYHDGFMDGTNLNPYIDRSHNDSNGKSCTLNCFAYQSLVDAARLHEVLSKSEEAAAYRKQAAELAERIRAGFWDAQRGVYLDRLKDDAADAQPSVPGNVLPMLYGIATDEQRPSMLDFVSQAMLNNFRVPEPKTHTDCNIGAYFSYYALQVLYDHGRVAEAEAFMRTYWGRMLEHGAWTCWEFLEDFHGASRCHAWATAPTYALSSRALGVTFPEPGNPKQVRIAPRASALTWASGKVPHPDGTIDVAWWTVGKKRFLRYNAPEGVNVAVADGFEWVQPSEML